MRSLLVLPPELMAEAYPEQCRELELERQIGAAVHGPGPLVDLHGNPFHPQEMGLAEWLPADCDGEATLKCYRPGYSAKIIGIDEGD